MRIEVTQELIDSSPRENYTHCAIANAIRAALPEGVDDDIEVDGINICINGEVFTTPPVAEDFINAFEAYEPVSPFSFDLPIEERA